MFYDMLHIYQDFNFPIKVIGDRFSIVVDTDTGKDLGISQPVHKYEGSHSTTIKIFISGNRITMKGNPSRINRLDNLFGFSTIEQCVAVFNKILLSLGLPPFTKCTKVFHRQNKETDKVTFFSDGAIITELHLTSNKSTGQGLTDPHKISHKSPSYSLLINFLSVLFISLRVNKSAAENKICQPK